MKEIRYLPIKDLTLLENNPRTISKDQFENLCKSLENDSDFLNHRPILVNLKDGKHHVYAGNQRVRAAKKLKWKSIPCIVDEDLSEDTMKRRIAIDNLHFGNWDFEILANEYEIDELIEFGFNENILLENFEIQEQEDLSKSDKKNEKICPSCGNKF